MKDGSALAPQARDTSVSYRRFVGLSLAGATVLLTGASAGIGAAAAPVLAGRGATLVVTGRLRGIVEWKTADPDAYLAGVAEMARGTSP
jgi:NAD(P)-dependent dehydrogenase (short-subunit alcohol dehydrogenase family)